MRVMPVLLILRRVSNSLTWFFRPFAFNCKVKSDLFVIIIIRTMIRTWWYFQNIFWSKYIITLKILEIFKYLIINKTLCNICVLQFYILNPVKNILLKNEL